LFPGLALTPEERVPRIDVAPASGRRPIVIHPGSGSRTKNWPVDRFVALAAALAAEGPIVWVVGPVEEESGIVAATAAAAIPGATSWRELPLEDLARHLAGARLFVGNDSGVAHLAAAVGCPVVVLFGASDPLVWAPRGKSVTVVGDGTGGMAAIGIDVVARAVQGALAADRHAHRGREGMPPG
jgi:ADP-heptose:LPS heptosyltransferase